VAEERPSSPQLFDLTGRTAIITGGAGLLGIQHAEAIAEMGGIPILMDLPSERLDRSVERLAREFGVPVSCAPADITRKDQVERAVRAVVERFGKIDILINNAGFTGKGQRAENLFAPFEDYPLELWVKALEVNLTGAFLVTQAAGKVMRDAKRGVVVNIASDVGVISPDHRIYEGQPFNTPVAYATTKAALINFTRYLATYWAPYGIRVNALSPAGVFDGHDAQFVHRLTQLIPLGRMAHRGEYKGAIIFLVSDASSFMTGANLVVDGGRTCW
jgi:NAD(P)-dependent dehydrogenase (short-subunit alcohol dehydrogenase family)